MSLSASNVESGTELQRVTNARNTLHPLLVYINQTEITNNNLCMRNSGHISKYSNLRYTARHNTTLRDYLGGK